MKRIEWPQSRVSCPKIGLAMSDRREASGSSRTKSDQSGEGLRQTSARGVAR